MTRVDMQVVDVHQRDALEDGSGPSRRNQHWFDNSDPVAPSDYDTQGHAPRHNLRLVAILPLIFPGDCGDLNRDDGGGEATHLQ